MTKKEIVQKIAEETGLTRLLATQIVQIIFDSIVDILVADGRVELRNFGVFEVRLRQPRKARNPITGEDVEVPARLTVTFKPGQVMQQRVSEVRGDGDPTRSPEDRDEP